MLQYPAATLCTELWKRVGESCRSELARTRQISWQFKPSPPEEENTVASVLRSIPQRVVASKPTASASLTTPPVRRRSAGGNESGSGNTVAAATYGASPASIAAALGQSAKPGPSTPIPSI